MKGNGRQEELQRWKSEAIAELAEAQSSLAVAQQRVEACRERIRLLDQLIAVENGTKMTGPKEGNATEVALDLAHAGDELLDACENLVRDAGRPLHIKELHA